MNLSFKRFWSFALAAVLLLTALVAPVSAATFSDTKGHWAQDAVEKWNANGIVSGYEGHFRPNDAVTRAEFAAMINNIIKYTDTGDNAFSDLSTAKWYYDAMIKLNKAGVLNGSGGKALPDQKITRQEAAVILAKAFHIADGSAPTSFKDESTIANWAKGAINALVSQKIVIGTPDNQFKPLGNLTRAEAVQMFNNFIQELISQPGEYAQDVQGNLVVNSPGVVLQNMKITGDLYITQGVGEGEVTLNHVEIAGSVFVRGGGEHSILFNSVDVKGALVVNKNNGKIRILATGSTSVSVTKLESGALIVTKELTGGGFETIEISADTLEGQEVVLDGNFNKVINHSASTPMTANGKIKELIATVDTKITGTVVIDKLTADSGVTASVNDKAISTGTGNTGNTSSTGSTGSTGGGSSNGGGGGSGGGNVTVAVTGVSLNKQSISLAVGTTKPLTATVQPAEATNKKVTWKVVDDSQDVVTVDQNGVLTGVGIGTKTVAVVTEDGAKSAQITVKVTAAGVVDAGEVFDAIEASYLASNADRNNITSNLNLMTSLADFPGVTITWVSDTAAAITNEGVITRGEKDDQFVKLTVSLSGAVTDSRTYDFIVRAKGTDQVIIGDYIDSYFAEGYPQAYVKDGTIHVRYKLNAPADVYMVVNAMNGLWDSNVKSVLEGRAGDDSTIVWVDKWPFFRIDSEKVNQLQDFDTHVSLSDRAAQVNFVIRDSSKSYTSSDVTTVKFDQATVDALDTYPPTTYGSYLNDDLNTLYLYYNEKLDLNSMPAVTDYKLNHGTVDQVTLYNYSSEYGLFSSYVKLSVSGIQAADKNDLWLSYSGHAIRDLSDAHNQANSFMNQKVAIIDEQIVDAKITSNRKSMIVEIVPGWNIEDNKNIPFYNPERFAVSVEGHGTYTPLHVNYGYSWSRLWYTLEFASPLPAGKASVTVNTTGIINWAMEAYPNILTTDKVTELVEAGTPTASYSYGTIKLTFADDFDFNSYSFTAAGLVLKVDGIEYPLRGFIVSKTYNNGKGNGLLIDLNETYSWLFKNAVNAGSKVEIKYTKVNGDSRSQLSDSAGALISDFDYITVTK